MEWFCHLISSLIKRNLHAWLHWLAIFVRRADEWALHWVECWLAIVKPIHRAIIAHWILSDIKYTIWVHARRHSRPLIIHVVIIDDVLFTSAVISFLELSRTYTTRRLNETIAFLFWGLLNAYWTFLIVNSSSAKHLTKVYPTLVHLCSLKVLSLDFCVTFTSWLTICGFLLSLHGYD